MKLSRTALWATVAATALLAAGSSILSAKPAENDTPVTAPIEKHTNLSPGEMKTTSKEYLKEMQQVLVEVVDLQQLARKQKDVIKLNCVNDQLLQEKQLLNLADKGHTDLLEAIARHDQSAAHLKFSVISIAKERSVTQRDEARGCIGDELSFLGETEVTTNAPEVRDDPTGQTKANWKEIIERTAYASPFE